MTRIRQWFLGLSLARKLTVLATATSAMSMAVLFPLLGWSDSRALHRSLVRDTGVLVDMVGASSEAALAFGDAKGAAQTLGALKVNTQVARAAILLPDGAVLAHYVRSEAGSEKAAPQTFAVDPMWRQGRTTSFVNSHLAMSNPIFLDGELIGGVYIEVALTELNARLMALWWSLGLALIGTVILATIVAWRLQRIVSGPIVHLTNITRLLMQEGNYSVRAVRTSNDEIGELVSGFNDMVEDIQRRDAALQSHRHELEDTVALRTAEVLASSERYRMLVENTHAIPWEMDGRSFRLLYIAPQIASLVGYTSAELLEQSIDFVIYPDDRRRVVAQIGALVAATSGDLDIEFRMLSKAKRAVNVRSIMTVRGAEVDGALIIRGVTLDVTQQKKLELELRQAQKLESVGRLAAGVAHEINTPVQFVSDSVHFVRDAVVDLAALIRTYQDFHGRVVAGSVDGADTDRVSQAAEDADLDYLLENVPKALERSLDGLDRVATIVRSMKEFAHPDQKEMAPIDLNQAIASTLTIARNEYKYVADIETDFGDLPMVTCLAGDINQAILNIVINASHAIEAVVQGTENRGLIKVQTLRCGGFVEIRIGDTGGGIPQDIQERIFDPFFTTKQVGKGTGQGLAIARSVVLEKHKGELTFQSEPGKGTTFIIRLPADGVRDTGAAA